MRLATCFFHRRDAESTENSICCVIIISCRVFLCSIRAANIQFFEISSRLLCILRSSLRSLHLCGGFLAVAFGCAANLAVRVIL
jgi:hypothetical protein